MNTAGIVKTYSNQSPFYDLLFHPFYGAGQARAIDTLDLVPGQRVLEVGAGTGLSLRHYPPRTRLTGIDLSAAMLNRARVKARGLGLNADFQIMDAQAMDFADGSFDHVLAMHLCSVVPDPAVLISEMRRVCRPGGSLTVVNYLCEDNLPMKALRILLSPLKSPLGFRPLFSRRAFLDAAQDLDWQSVDGRDLGFVVLRARCP